MLNTQYIFHDTEDIGFNRFTILIKMVELCCKGVNKIVVHYLQTTLRVADNFTRDIADKNT